MADKKRDELFGAREKALVDLKKTEEVEKELLRNDELTVEDGKNIQELEKELDRLLEVYKKANDEWQKYYDKNYGPHDSNPKDK